MIALADEEVTRPCAVCPTPKQLIAASVFALIGVWLAWAVPTVEIAWVIAILLLTIFLFAFEVVAVDVAAASIMVRQTHSNRRFAR